MKKLSIFLGIAIMGMALIAFAGAPTTLNDFFLAGSQPGQSGNLEHPDKCDNCHGGYDQLVEPAFNWRGSMMAQAARDPLFYACLAIANQDAPGSGDLCIRCHSPAGWLEGRSVPTDGSALNNNDREGVQCDFCHKLVKPAPLGVNPYPDDPNYTANTFPADQSYLQTLTDIPPTSANGMYVCDANNAKRGPFADAAARHQMFYSPFHKEAALCGTCHDVSNPAFDRQPDDSYSPNAFDAPTSDFNPYSQFPIERTYSEWLNSAYNSDTGIYAPQFGGNKQRVATCQDCHMHDVSGFGCNKNGAPHRDDLPLHDLTGGNTFIPDLVNTLFPGEVNPAALQDGKLRATAMLQKAASMDLTVTPSGTQYLAKVRVTNETGHKLPSGYPEGRRIWINIKAFDSNGGVVYESGAYDNATGILTHDGDAKIYEIKPGISEELAPVLGVDPGPSFHFAINHKVFFDNRIPPRGFDNAVFTAIQSPPIGYSYPDGQYWDDSYYTLPGSTVRVEATLYYQITSKEYVEFLRDENVTNDWGQVFYDLWVANGKAAPVVMNFETINVSPPATEPPVADFVGSPLTGYAPLTVQFTDLSSNSPTSWLWNFGDSQTSTEMNPAHTYITPGIYSVTLTATNDFGSGSLTRTDYVAVSEMVQPYIHVENIDVTRINLGGPNFAGQASVHIHDQNNQPVVGAQVSGVFNAPNTRIKSGVTDANGFAVIVSDKTKNPPADWCFEVTGVVLAGAVYDAAANIVTVGCESGPGSVANTGQQAISSAYPNPFNPSVVISFTLEQPGQVSLDIFNVTGQRVASLADRRLETGRHDFKWDAANMPSGIYFYRLKTDRIVETKKLILLK